MATLKYLIGQLQRLLRIDAEVFYSLFEELVIDDTKAFNGNLQELESFCN